MMASTRRAGGGARRGARLPTANILLLTAAAAAAAAAANLPRYNWTYFVVSTILIHLAPLKERHFPSSSSDDASVLTPESRGLAWVLNSGPPPPHDVDQVRFMTDEVWPRVWDGLPGVEEGLEVEEVSIPVRSAVSGAVVYTEGEESPSSPRRALLFRPKEEESKQLKEDGGGRGPAVVFVHGGGLVAGTPRTEWGVSAELARRCGCPVLSVDYRTAPEVTVDEAVSDVVAAFDWMASSADVLEGGGVGYHPRRRRISIVGGSAGGILSLLAGIALRDRPSRDRLPPPSMSINPPPPPPPQQPASLGLLSPGPGLEFLSDPPEVAWPSLVTNADRDGFMKGGFYQFVRKLVFDSKVNRLYFWSALGKGDLSGLPPCLVTVGEYEVMLDGVRALRDRLGQAGVDVDYREYDRLQHVHHALFFVAKESSEALDDIVLWLQLRKIST